MPTNVLSQLFHAALGSRCRSWRPRTGASAHPAGHVPGVCRVCWRPCLHRVPSGENRCPDCLWALAQHPDPRVRLALVNQPRVPAEVLQLLLTDPDPLVAAAAERGAGFHTVTVDGIGKGRVVASGSR